MKKYRIHQLGHSYNIFDVEMETSYGWVLVKRFRGDINDIFDIKYAQERAEELLEKLEEEL
ncbi:hypothetical protein [Bacteroides uniformis]|uniref:hypothetical protein n=1 Tax=Bacteroides uniformis TaxID=820 RepID=UPI00202DD6BD|nr:hypothetical protein [Bacteroides uniformis]MCM1730916.1 hypothetical protein [Bacteroides uniformis]MCM1929478.1 hypothetical protein [Bacteroides uniformis]MCM1932982.1 hypothetical protein [Bacteroides uniformis]